MRRYAGLVPSQPLPRRLETQPVLCMNPCESAQARPNKNGPNFDNLDPALGKFRRSPRGRLFPSAFLYLFRGAPSWCGFWSLQKNVTFGSCSETCPEALLCTVATRYSGVPAPCQDYPHHHHDFCNSTSVACPARSSPQFLLKASISSRLSGFPSLYSTWRAS